MRMASESPGISMLNTATGASDLIAAFSAMFMAKLVLPIDGRPAIDDQVGRLQPGGHVVEVGEAGRHSR